MLSMGLNTDGLKGLDQSTSFARRAEMADGDFLQRTIHDFSLLEGAQKYTMLIGTFPLLRYFLVLKKTLLGYHLYLN